jgi:sugar transferase (PEP-CTERM system associated)
MPSWSKIYARAPILILAMAEAAVLYVSVYVAHVISFGGVQAGEELLGPIAPRAAALSLVMVLSLIAMGLYQFHQRIYFHEILVRILVGVGIGSLVLALAYYALPAIMLQPKLAAIATLGSLTFLLLLRFVFVRSVDENVFRRRTLVFGAGERSAPISMLRRRADRRGFKVVGKVPAPGDASLRECEYLVRGDRSLLEIAVEENADEIVIAMDDRRGNLPVRDLLDCRLRGIDVIDLVGFLERETGKIRIDLVNPGWLIFSEGFRISKFRRVFKRAVDIAASTALFLVTWPVMLVIVLAVKFEDGPNAPVFYRQCRVGQGGKPFQCLKFRSMRVDAEADGKAVWAKKNDDRITFVGNLLRNSRLDELPQVFNVLKGEMSLVGPRPERPEFVEGLQKKIPYYGERHAVKPGVTGWAQLKYSYGASEEDAAEKLQYDLYYVKNQSFILDIMIILQTVEVVLWGKGAR